MYAHGNWRTDGSSVVCKRGDEQLGGPENTTALPHRSLALMKPIPIPPLSSKSCPIESISPPQTLMDDLWAKLNE